MTNHLYEAVVIADFNGTEIVNRYNYLGDVVGVASGDAFGLASAMGYVPEAGVFTADSLAAEIAALVSNGIEWGQIIVRNIYVPTDFVELPFVPVAPGLVSGDVEAGFVAFGCRSNRVRTDIGRGYKRFAGVNESNVNSYGELTSGALAQLEVIAGLLQSTLTYTEGSDTNTYKPVIVGKEKIVVEGEPTLYRYYADEAEQLEHLAIGTTWEAYDHVRSQVSRKIGHGS